jgi:hypothetical protein
MPFRLFLFQISDLFQLSIGDEMGLDASILTASSNGVKMR